MNLRLIVEDPEAVLLEQLVVVEREPFSVEIPRNGQRWLRIRLEPFDVEPADTIDIGTEDWRELLEEIEGQVGMFRARAAMQTNEARDLRVAGILQNLHVAVVVLAEHLEHEHCRHMGVDRQAH